jgi:hypothetical protein
MAFVNDRPLSFAMRRLTRPFRGRGALPALFLVVALLGISGPFGTYEALSPVPRLAYWTLNVLSTYAIRRTAGELVEGWLVGRGQAPGRAWLASVVLAAIPITGAVALLARAFGIGGGATDAALLFGQCIAVSFAVALGFLWLQREGQAQAAPAQPAILRRLPAGKRGELIRISAQDHYVEVVTDKGRDLVLIRLADAVSETLPGQGVRVHRSHWVATRQVRGHRRIRGQSHLVLSDGSLVPISRTGVKAAMEQSLL